LISLPQVSQVDHETVQATALKIVFDLLHVYGFNAFIVDNGRGGEKEEREGGSEFPEVSCVYMFFTHLIAREHVSQQFYVPMNL
jgi:hypothetical protein